MESIKELSRKLDNARSKNALLTKKNQNQARRIREVESSRSKWKCKSKANNLKINSLKRRGFAVSNLLGPKASKHWYSIDMMSLCLSLRLVAGCSFRSIVKVIEVFHLRSVLEVSDIPCANTIENWVKKMGYYEMVYRVGAGLEDCVGVIVDESMRVGPYKQLLVLGLNAAKTDSSPLDYSKVRVLHMSMSKSYTGDHISDILVDIERQTGKKIVYGVSDDDSKIKKAFRLRGTPRISDVSHAMGRCLEKTFKEDALYQSFSKAVVHWQHTGVNRPHAYLLPPKQRVMARFMNIAAVVEWGKGMLRGFERLTKEEQAAFIELKHHEVVLNELGEALTLAKSVSLYLKKEGLCPQNIKECLKMIKQEDSSSPPLVVFKNHLSGYLNEMHELIKDVKERWQCSSEVIESMFGKRKARDADNRLVQNGVNVLEIPLYCLSQAELFDRICPAMESISVPKTHQWLNEQFPDNQSFKRNKFFKNEKIVK